MNLLNEEVWIQRSITVGSSRTRKQMNMKYKIQFLRSDGRELNLLNEVVWDTFMYVEVLYFFSEMKKQNII